MACACKSSLLIAGRLEVLFPQRLAVITNDGPLRLKILKAD